MPECTTYWVENVGRLVAALHSKQLGYKLLADKTLGTAILRV